MLYLANLHINPKGPWGSKLNHIDLPSYCVSQIGEYAELGDVKGTDLDKDESEFLKVCESRIADNGGKLKVVDVNKKESEIQVTEITTLNKVVEQLKEEFPGLVHIKIPTCNSAAPSEADFDIIR